MVERNGKFGKFYGCSKFPACRATMSVYENNMAYDHNFGDDPWDFLNHDDLPDLW